MIPGKRRDPGFVRQPWLAWTFSCWCVASLTRTACGLTSGQQPFRAVAPARGYAIHDATLNDAGLGLMSRMMSVAAAPSGAPVARLEPGASLEL